LIDPDFIFLRPLTRQIAGHPSNLYMKGFDLNTSDVPKIIGRGQPAGQLYGLGAPWATTTATKDFNRTHICGEGSPCLTVKQRFGQQKYSVGPPYLVEKDDFIRLADAWTRFVPRVYESYPELLAEMYAYSMGAAHAELPHFTMTHYMVSNTFVNEEGWPWIDVLDTDVCVPPTATSDSDPNGVGERLEFYPGKSMPIFLHYCQFFRAGELGFQKRRFRKDMFQCDRPMMVDPPLDLGTVDYKNRDGEIIKITPQQAKRNAFALCTIHRSINKMLTYYKRIMCTAESDVVNLNKTVNAVSKKYWTNDGN
jgi:hypothetical protein